MNENLSDGLSKKSEFDSNLTNLIIDIATPIEISPKIIISTPEFKSRKAIYVNSGLVKYYCLGKKGEEIVLNFRSGPDFLVYSLSGFYMDAPGITYCETLTKLEGYQVDAKDLMELANENPEIYHFLLTSVTKDYQMRQIKEYNILEKSIKERYLDFAKTYAEHLDHIPLKGIASFLNIQPGSLSRLRKELNT